MECQSCPMILKAQRSSQTWNIPYTSLSILVQLTLERRGLQQERHERGRLHHEVRRGCPGLIGVAVIKPIDKLKPAIEGFSLGQGLLSWRVLSGELRRGRRQLMGRRPETWPMKKWNVKQRVSTCGGPRASTIAGSVRTASVPNNDAVSR